MSDLLRDLTEVLNTIAEYIQHERNEAGCSNHQDAPHGFDRNGSHSEDRYVCDCEGWEPEPADDHVCRQAMAGFFRRHGTELERTLRAMK